MTEVAEQDVMHNDIEKPKVPLYLDLVGPFLVHFVDRQVRVHAPMCIDHHANVLTDSDDVSLYGLGTSTPPPGCSPRGFVYGFKNGTGPADYEGGCGGLDDQHSGYLVVKSKIDPIAVSSSQLVFKLPRPNAIVPLVKERLFVHRNNAIVWLDPDRDLASDGTPTDCINGLYARALRFIYYNTISQPVIELCNCPDLPEISLQKTLDRVNPLALGFDPHFYHLTLRFASTTAEPDDNHEDAYRCFQTMRGLYPDTLPWRADFDDIYGGGGDPAKIFARQNPALLVHGGPHPVDCSAAIMVVQS